MRVSPENVLRAKAPFNKFIFDNFQSKQFLMNISMRHVSLTNNARQFDDVDKQINALMYKLR